jgi:hypothetical protein
VSKPKVSALRNYKLSGFSVERLMNLLTALHQDVEIVIRRKPAFVRLFESVSWRLNCKLRGRYYDQTSRSLRLWPVWIPQTTPSPCAATTPPTWIR